MKHNFKLSLILFVFGLVLLGTLIVLLPRGEATVTFAQTTSAMTATITGNATINSVYAADLVSPATLRTKTGQTAKDASLQTMQYPLRLADSKYFTGNQFTVYVYNWLHVTAANIVFPCVLINSSGATININITLTGNGTYNIGATGFYITSCTQCQVTYETGTGATFAYKVNQSRYGAIWHPYNTTSTQGYQAWGIDSVKLDLGGASNTPTNFSFKNLNMNFFSSGRYATSNTITPNVYVRKNTHTSFENCQFFWNYTSTFSNYSSMISLYSNYNVLISNCSFMAYRHYQMQAGSTTNVYINNSVFKNLGWVVGRLHLRDVTFISGSGDSSGGSLGGNMGLYSVNVVESDSVYVTGCVNAIKCNAYNFWLNGTTLKSNTYFLAAYAMAFTGKLYNVVSDTWTICPLSTWSGGRISRMYSYDNRFVNGINPESGVTVKIWNKTMALKFTETSDINGLIPRHILSVENWTSNTPVWYTPFTVNMSKGAWYVNFTFNLTAPLNWTIPIANCVLITGENLTLTNPNPANSTTIYDTNYIKYNVSGLTLSIDVNSTLFNTYSVMVGIQSNMSGGWVTLSGTTVYNNGTVSFFYPELNQPSYTYYWRVYAHINTNYSVVINTKIFTFTTSPLPYYITLKNPNPANGKTVFNSNLIQNDTGGLALAVDLNYNNFSEGSLKLFFWVYDGTWYGDSIEDIFTNGTKAMFFNEINKSNFTYYWYVQVYSNADYSFIYTTENYTFTTSDTTKINDNWLYIGSFDINSQFLLISIFFGLLYFWWKSEKIGMMSILTMLIVPYDYVVITTYVLPLYIPAGDILLFIQGIFILLSIIVIGYTLDAWNKSINSKKNSVKSD